MSILNNVVVTAHILQCVLYVGMDVRHKFSGELTW